MVDPNMTVALQWACDLGPSFPLPRSLEDAVKRAELVDTIDGLLVRSSILNGLTLQEKVHRLQTIGKLSAGFIPDVGEETNRVNVVLRLWSGCLMVAKTIALETRSGPNTPEMRRVGFANFIDRIVGEDPIFLAGVEAAPAFKRLRDEPYSFDGAPENSAVRRYV